MHNLDTILEKIEDESLRRIALLHQETDEQAARMQAETEAVIAGLEIEAKAMLRKETDKICARADAAVAVKKRAILLQNKISLLEEVYERVEKALLSMPEEQYIGFLAGLASSAVVERVNTVRFLQAEYRDEAFENGLTEEYILLFSPADRRRVGKAVLASAEKQVAAVIQSHPVLVLGEETTAISGGVVVRYGDTETVCSVPVILSGLRENLDPMVLKILLPQEYRQKGVPV